MAKISLVGQISEIDREIRMREQVYPKQIRDGKMRQAEAELAVERIHAVRATLVFIQENEAEIRAFIEQRKQERAATSRGQA